jgi:hypothetical protein
MREETFRRRLADGNAPDIGSFSAPVPTSLFLSHNESLAPPYRVLVDTNFINLSLENRIEMISGMMDSLYAKCESAVVIIHLSIF